MFLVYFCSNVKLILFIFNKTVKFQSLKRVRDFVNVAKKHVGRFKSNKNLSYLRNFVVTMNVLLKIYPFPAIWKPICWFSLINC